MGTTDIDGKLLLPPEDIAEIIGKSTTTVYRLCDRGELEWRKLDSHRKRLITLESAERYKASNGMTLKDLSLLVLQMRDKISDLEAEVRRLKGEKTQETVNEKSYNPEAIKNLFRAKNKNLFRQ